jgi:beta-galactosidase
MQVAFALLLLPSARAEVSDATLIDQGWRLWLDPKAAWQDDVLYLPEEVKLGRLPVNPPTGGWAVLSEHAGMSVSLPATVEQFHFNRAPARTTASSSPAEIVAVEGFYQGVSWWYRPFTPPLLRPGERLVFYFPAGRLRSEVYVNGKLAGYSILSEAPFTADATDAINPGGTNLLAVRITNPGGRLDWMDFLTMTWGKYTLPATHAFGGLAGGVEMQARAPVSVSDLAVLNQPDPRSVRVQAEISSTGQAYDGPIEFSIVRDGSVSFKVSKNVYVPSGATLIASVDATVTNAQLWDIAQPNLYRATATLPALAHSDRSTTFGFRWLEVKGLGTDAKLYLNGRRIVPRSSISWGFWAPNGIFPDEAAAGREIAAMKALGLDSLQNHRHMPKAVVLDAFDRVGFLRYCEAGGGLLTFEPAQHEPPHTGVQVKWNGQPVELDFLNRYQLAKELAMIRAFRSHPCVTLWTLQNETSPDVNNPRMRYALEKMREADPSRMVILKSGVGVENQVWCLPYNDAWMKDDGKGYSGWWDQHTAMDSPGVWVDAMYKSPADFKYRLDNKREIVVWGEMATGASPDDHAAMVDWYQSHDLTGYDREAHQAILAAYEKFLDQHRFRPAFPTARTLFQQAGAKHYFSAARLLENARICDTVDYVVLSGWESTTIDDHSGLVDALRQLKADPSLCRQAAQPEVLVLRPRRSVIARGETAVVDVHQINEQNLAGSWFLKVTASLAGRAPLFQEENPVQLLGGETFGQLLKQNIAFKADQPGLVTIRATLSSRSGGPPALEREEPLLVVDPQPAPLNGTIACCGESEELIAALKRQFNVQAVAFSTNLGNLPTILLTTAGGGLDGWQASFTDASVAKTDDPELYKNQMWGQAGLIHTWRGLAPGKITVKLHLDDGYSAVPGQRLFDIAINGSTVAKDFDIFAKAGGKDRALVEAFIVDAPEGTIRLAVPRVASDNATFAAVELRDSSGKVVRAIFWDKPYTDPAGNVWTPITQQVDDAWMPDLHAAVARARLDGTRVVLLTSGGSDAERVAAYLADQGLVDYSGPVGPSGPSWMGFWFFGRRHALLAGLPADGVLDWPYQITTGNGLMLSGPGLATVVGYGRNHDPNVGVAAAVVPCGRGRLVLLALPGLMDAFINDASGRFQPVTAKRLMFNALNL